MIFDMLTYLIVFFAVGMLLKNVLTFFHLIKTKNNNPAKCAGCSSGCEIKTLHIHAKGVRTKKDPYKVYL